MSTVCGQLFYTSSRRGAGAGAGFQTLALSRDITAGERLELERLLLYTPPRQPPAADAAADAAAAACLYPVNHGFARLASGRAAVFASRYAGRDYSGRQGNFLGHAFVLEESGALPVRPAQLIGWRRFFAGAADLLERVEGGAPPTAECLTVEDWATEVTIRSETVQEFLAAGRQKPLERLVTALLAGPKTGRRLLLTAPPAEAAAWLAALQSALPLPWMDLATFATFAPDPAHLRAAICVPPPEAGDLLGDASTRARGFFDFDARTQETSPSPGDSWAAARLVQEAFHRQPDGAPGQAEEAARRFPPPRNAEDCEAALGLIGWLDGAERPPAPLPQLLAFAGERAHPGTILPLFSRVFEQPEKYAAGLSVEDIAALLQFIAGWIQTGNGERAWASWQRLLRCGLLTHNARDGKGAADLAARALPALPAARLPELVAMLLAETDFPRELRAAVVRQALGPCAIDELFASARPPEALAAGEAFAMLAEDCAAAALAASDAAMAAKTYRRIAETVRASGLSCADALSVRIFACYTQQSRNPGQIANACLVFLQSPPGTRIDGRALATVFSLLDGALNPDELPPELNAALLRDFLVRYDEALPVRLRLLAVATEIGRAKDFAGAAAALGARRIFTGAAVGFMLAPLIVAAAPIAAMAAAAASLSGSRDKKSESMLDAASDLPTQLSALDDPWWRVIARRLCAAAARRARRDEDFDALFRALAKTTPERLGVFTAALAERFEPAPLLSWMTLRRFHRLFGFFLRRGSSLPDPAQQALRNALRHSLNGFPAARRDALLKLAARERLAAEARNFFTALAAPPGLFSRGTSFLRSLFQPRPL